MFKIFRLVKKYFWFWIWYFCLTVFGITVFSSPMIRYISDPLLMVMVILFVGAVMCGSLMSLFGLGLIKRWELKEQEQKINTNESVNECYPQEDIDALEEQQPD